jgi:hypothetical protein
MPQNSETSPCSVAALHIYTTFPARIQCLVATLHNSLESSPLAYTMVRLQQKTFVKYLITWRTGKVLSKSTFMSSMDPSLFILLSPSYFSSIFFSHKMSNNSSDILSSFPMANLQTSPLNLIKIK